MAMDVSTLTVKVESKGIDSTTKALQGLEKQADNTSKSVDMLINKMSASSGSMQAIVTAMSQVRAQMAGVMPTGAITSATGALKEMLDELKKIQAAMNLGGGKTMAITYKEIGDNSKEAVKGVESLNQSLAKGQNVFQAVGKELYHIRNLLGGTMLAAALAGTTKKIIEFTDAWSLSQAKLKVALGGMAQANIMQEELYKSAQQLRVPMEEMTKLYVRLVPAMKEYGYSTQDALAVTKSMSAALSLSGATAAETASVLLQFSQAMQAGRLNGAEFNAIAEGAPIVLRAVQKELLVTRKQLKDMGADGEISVTILTDVMKKYEKQWTKTAEEMPLTFDKAMTKLENAFKRFLGTADSARNGVSAVASVINFLANNLEMIGSGVLAVVTSAIVFFTAKTLLAIPAVLGFGSAAATAAAQTTLLAGALNLLKAHPIIMALSALAGVYVLVASSAEKAKTPVEEANEAINAALKLGEAGPSQLSKLIEEQNALISQSTKELEKWQQKKKTAYGFQDVVYYNERISELKTKVAEATVKQKEYTKALEESNAALRSKVVSDKIKDIQQEIAMMQYGISVNKQLSSTEKEIFKTKKEISRIETEIAQAKKLNPKIDTSITEKKLDEERKVLEVLEQKSTTEEIYNKIGKKTATVQKDQESAAKKLANAYTKAVESAKEFLAKQEEELGLKRKLTDAEREVLKIRSDVEGKFKGIDTGELRNLAEKIKLQGEQAIVQEKLNESMDDYFKKLTQTMEAEDSFAEASFKSAEAQRQKLLTVQRQIADTNQTPLGEAMESSEADQRRIDFINKQISATQKLIEETLTLEYTKAISSGDTKQQERVWALMEARQKYIDTLKLEKLGIEDNTKSLEKYLEELFKLPQITMSEMGRSPGQILADGFGEAGNAISSMLSAYQDFGKESKKINEELAAQQKYLTNKGASADEFAKVEQAAADKRMQINAQMFGSMAKNAKGFFSEQSKGYKALEKAEKAFRTVELALAIKNNAQKLYLMGEELAMFIFNSTKALAVAIETSMASATAAAPAAVANAAIQPGPLAFVGAAAMIALLAGLGIAVAGGGSSGGNANISAERQAAAGTGTVFGDSTAKSESVSKSLELVAENTSISAKYNDGMLTSLRNIENSLKGAANILIRSGVQKQLGSASGMGTFKSSLGEALHGSKAMTAEMLLPGVGSTLIRDITNALFKTKKSVIDSGILQVSQTLEDVIVGGLDVFGFTTVETKTKKWGRTKTSVEENISDLDTLLKDQFTLTVVGLSDTIKEAAKLIGTNGTDFTSRLNNFVVDIGHISLQGLTSEQIQEQFATIFSKLGDEMALAAIPGLDNFQEVGEGYLETLIRVASTVATVDGIFNELGSTFGLVGDGSYTAKLALVDLAGGLSELQSVASAFYEAFTTDKDKLSNQVRLIKQGFADLGITVEEGQITAKTARADFKRFFDEVANSGTATQEMLLGLMQIGLMVDKIAPAFEKVKTEAEKAAENLESVKSALSGLQSKASTALSDLERSVTAEKTSAKKAFDERMKGLKKQRDDLVESQRIERANLESHLNTLEDQRVAGVQAQITANETYLDSVRSVRDNLKTLFDDIDGAIKTLTNSQTTLQSSTYQLAKSQLDSALATARMSGSLPDAEKFKDVLATITGIGNEAFSSSFQMQREKLVSAGKLAELRGITGGQLGQKDLQVQLLEQQLVALNNMTSRNDAGIAATLAVMDNQHAEDLAVIDEEIRKAEEEYNNYINRLDGILETAKEALAIADGTYRVLLSVDGAITNFGNVLAGYVAYQDQQKALLQSQVDMVSMKNSSLQLTVEQVNAGAEALAAEVRQMKEELKAGNLAIASNTLQTAKVLSQWDGDGQPETRNVA